MGGGVSRGMLDILCVTGSKNFVQCCVSRLLLRKERIFFNQWLDIGNPTGRAQLKPLVIIIMEKTNSRSRTFHSHCTATSQPVDHTCRVRSFNTYTKETSGTYTCAKRNVNFVYMLNFWGNNSRLVGHWRFGGRVIRMLRPHDGPSRVKPKR